MMNRRKMKGWKFSDLSAVVVAVLLVKWMICSRLKKEQSLDYSLVLPSVGLRHSLRSLALTELVLLFFAVLRALTS